MKLKPRYLLAVFLIFIAAAGVAGLWGIVYWPLIIRNHYYWELVGDFQRAHSETEIQGGDEKGGWDFQIQIPGSKTTAQVRASSNIGIATIKYSDEGGLPEFPIAFGAEGAAPYYPDHTGGFGGK
jgi:hypothetical protein